MKIESLLGHLNYTEFLGNANSDVEEILKLGDLNASNKTLVWINEANSARVESISIGTVIAHPSAKQFSLKTECNYIFTEEPRRAFQVTLDLIYPEDKIWGTSKTAIIDESVEIGPTVFIGENVVIEKNVKIGANVIIGSNTVIKSKTTIGNEVTIGSNCTIGGVGFGYEVNEKGEQIPIKHIGGVYIQDHVEIGNNTCIDKATLGDTILRRGVKVDNLVHIAHGADIGENSVVIANAMVAGSVVIGKNSWIAPSSSIIDRVSLGDDVVVGLGAVVIKEVESNSVMVGSPARNIKKK